MLIPEVNESELTEKDQEEIATAARHLGMKQYIRRMNELYITNRQRYVLCYRKGEMSYMFIPRNGVLNNKVVAAHLSEKFSIGVFGGAKSTRFICFDVDLPDPEIVRRLIDTIEMCGIPREYIYPSLSGGKGYHVEIFFDGFVRNGHVRNFYNRVMERGGFDEKKVEFRPTASQAIKLPLSRHYKTGNVCWYVDRDTLAPIEDKSYLFQIRQISSAVFLGIVHELNRQRWLDLYNTYGVGGEEKAEPVVKEVCDKERGWPVLRKLGTRNSLMTKIAIYERNKGTPRDAIAEDLKTWIRMQDANLYDTDIEECDIEAENIATWVWGPKFVPKLKYEGDAKPKSKTNKEKKKFTCEVEIRRSDIVHVLQATTKTARKILFLVVFFDRMYGHANIGYEKIGEYVGASYQGVVKAVESIIQSKLMIRKRGGIIESRGRLTKKSNEYVIPKIHDDMGKSHVVTKHLSPETFHEIYYECIHELCGDGEIEDIMTAGEYKEYREVMHLD